MPRIHRRPIRSLAGAVQAVLILCLLAGGLAGTAARATASDGSQDCTVGGPTEAVKHVVYLQFDNVHFSRDNPNVPSDLEQMPHLLNFLKSNGVLLTNDHTALIAHTATGILTAVTGLYPDSHGVPVSNSLRYFNPDGTTSGAGAFGYWTAPLSPTHPLPRMIDKGGKNTPAPWVPYTRAGCDVGAVATANTVLENTGADISTVFGANSPEAQEAKATADQANRDFVGIGIHCAKTGSSACARTQHARPDLLPDEPGDYRGYQMIQGHKYVAEQNVVPVTAIDGSKITGFPGFDGMAPNVTLGYAASMLEHGVPVVYGYISDAHDNHASPGSPFGPGEAGYVQQLKAYDAGFAGFFERLQKQGIDASNTLFAVTVDEGDHFAGAGPAPAGCDGVNVPCTYARKGEVVGNLRGLIASQSGITTPFTVHADSAPTVYVEGNPDQFSPLTRNLERAFGAVKVDNPYTRPQEAVVNRLADQAEMRLLHMLTPADPARNMTFTAFAKEWYFLTAPPVPPVPPPCSTASPCVTIAPGFAWVHGTIAPSINNIWMAFAGPGVRRAGIDRGTWADHVDLRATLMALTGLKDGYINEGRVLYEDLEESVLPENVAGRRALVLALQGTLKQLDAPLGQFGLDSLAYGTAAVKSSSPQDSSYRKAVAELDRDGKERDQLAQAMLEELRGIEFEGKQVDKARAERLILHAAFLIARMHHLAAGDGAGGRD